MKSLKIIKVQNLSENYFLQTYFIMSFLFSIKEDYLITFFKKNTIDFNTFIDITIDKFTNSIDYST